MHGQELGFSSTRIELIGELWNDPTRLVANPATTRVLGYSREAMLGMRPGDLVVEPLDVAPLLAELAAGRSVGGLRVKLRHKDGHVVAVRLRIHRTRVATRELNITISEPLG
jgi:PAS domain S-box-containing protein